VKIFDGHIVASKWLEAGAEAPAGLLARKETALLASIREHYTPAPICTSVVQVQKCGHIAAWMGGGVN
jgi:hypothetical protein